MSDASFAEGAEKPIRLIAQDKDDAQVISTLVQDAIAERSEMLWEPKKHAFSMLLKRFRWEDVQDAQKQKRDLERVQSVLTIQSVLSAQFAGFEANETDLVFDLIGLTIESGSVHIVFAGDGEIKLNIEAIDMVLSDVSRPYVARAQKIPQHPED